MWRATLSIFSVSAWDFLIRVDYAGRGNWATGDDTMKRILIVLILLALVIAGGAVVLANAKQTGDDDDRAHANRDGATRLARRDRERGGKCYRAETSRARVSNERACDQS
jgi:hypothetical protein